MQLRHIFLDSPENPYAPVVRTVTFASLILLLAGFSTAVLQHSLGNLAPIWKYRSVFFSGWILTLVISAVALLLSSAIGLLVAILRRSPVFVLRSAATIFVEIIRGSPLLVLILFGYYVVFQAAPDSLRLPIGILILSLFSSAYISEMFRAGIESISASQIESANAIGLTTIQTYRFVIVPQAIRQTLPPLAGQFASLIKDSSLLSIIGLAEFTYSANQVNSATYSTLAAYFPLLIGYIILTLPISIGSRYLEHKLRYET